MKRGLRQSIWIRGVVLVGFLATLTVRGFHHPNTVAVRTATVSNGVIVHHIVATGDLEAVSTVQVGAQVSGTIQELDADYNTIVRAGQVIARLDPSLFEAALAEARASLARAEAVQLEAQANSHGFETAAEDARTKWSRAEELAAKQVIATSDLDSARTALSEATVDRVSGESQIEEAKAEVRQATAAVEQASIDLGHTVITSPIDGIVVARNVDVGQTVAATLQTPVLFTIATNLDHMQVQVDIDESDVGEVKSGARASFTVDAYPGETFEGTVTQVRLQPRTEQTAAAPPPGTLTPPAPSGSTIVSYVSIVDVSNPGEKLRPGMTATATLDGSRRDDVVRIPNAALAFRPPERVLDAAGQTADVPSLETGIDGQKSGSSQTSVGPDVPDRQVWRFDGARFTRIAVRVGLADDGWTEMTGGPLRTGDALVTSAFLSK